MNFRVVFSEEARKDLKKLDKRTAALIVGWIEKNLQNCENPRAVFATVAKRGKRLTANKSGQWRYRIGDYRVLAEIRDNEVVILLLSIGHRSKVYN